LGHDRGRAGRRQAERVAVGWRLGDDVVADQAAAAAAIVDDHRLLDLLGEGLGDRAHQQVARAAGGEGQDDLDRAARPLVGSDRKR